MWRKTDFGQSIWLAWGQTTAFTILNCLEYEFLKCFSVQGQQQSFWKFSILSNILDLQWCPPNKWKMHSQLSAMLTCRDGKGGKLSSQTSKFLYKPPGAVYIASYHSTNCKTIQIWSWCSRYLSSVGNRYPAIYVASYVLNVTTVPFEIKFTRPFLLQGFRLFCYQFVE